MHSAQRLGGGPVSMSVDVYQITVTDRVTTTKDFILSPDEVAQLLAEGIVRPGGVLRRFRFFINDFATRTRGVDIVGTHQIDGDHGITTISAAWNYNATEVTDFKPGTLTDKRIRILEDGLPNLRGNISVNHAFSNGLSLLVRGSQWGGYFDGESPNFHPSDPANAIEFPSRQLFDVEAAYTLSNSWTITLGGQNVLNTFPEEFPGASDGLGNKYGQYNPFGFNGGFYYSRLAYSW